MPEKPETNETTVSADRLASTIDAFIEVQDHVQAARNRLSVVSYDMTFHYRMVVGPSMDIYTFLQKLPDDARRQSFEVEAKLLLEHLEATMAELRKAQKKLLEMQGDGTEPQQECE